MFAEVFGLITDGTHLLYNRKQFNKTNMKKLITVLAITVSSFSFGQMQLDTKVNFMLGTVTGLATNLVTNLAIKEPKKAFLVSVCTTVALGIAKETFISNEFKIKNIAAFTLGGLAIAIPITSSRLLGKKMQRKFNAKQLEL